MDKLELEKEFLEVIKKRIKQERQEQIKQFEEIPLKYKGRYSDVKWGDEDLVANLLQMCSNRIKKLENLEQKPYFGSFIFTPDDTAKEEQFRLGKTDIRNKDEDLLVLDWRNPICTLYYEQSIGPVSYDAPMGTIHGQLINKKQIEIENGKIKSIKDIDLVSDDELLRPYLNVNADNKMKTIIASIQSEQNSIIRKPISNNLIVQGVAGSGKTSVALHRIAYLLYNNKKIDASKFVIIGPNKYFLDYISTILPDLDTDNATEYTFEELASEIINNANYNIETSNENLMRVGSNKNNTLLSYKGTLEYKELLNKFLEDYFNAILSKGLKINDIEILSSEYLKNHISVNKNYANSINNFVKMTSKRIKTKSDDMYYDLVKSINEKIKSLPLESEERKNLLKEFEELKNSLKKGCISELKKLVKPLLIDSINLYKFFIEHIEKYVKLTPEQSKLLKDESLKLLKKKIIPYEDVAAICYLNLLCNGTSDYYKYNHIIIDEAQDYSLFQFDVLKKMFSNSTFSIFGDLAQSVYSYRGLISWDDVKKNVFNDKCDILNMLKSYRTTKEITEGANSVLKQMNMEPANPVIRNGENIEFYNDSGSDEEFYTSKMVEYKEKKYKSIGIICKNEAEMTNVANIFNKLNIDYNYVTSSDLKYNGGISILTSSLAKGLEFDAVIINNASEEMYNSDSETDMHLLYVAMTRALHKLDIKYDSIITNALSEIKKQTMKDEKQKKLIKSM